MMLNRYPMYSAIIANSDQMSTDSKSSFEEGARGRNSGIFSEILHLLKHNKKYWLLPIIVMLLGFSLLIIIGGSAAAPFIYTLF